jgi:hypothetical protein
VIKDLEVETLSWTTWVHHKFPYKGEVGELKLEKLLQMTRQQDKMMLYLSEELIE